MSSAEQYAGRGLEQKRAKALAAHARLSLHVHELSAGSNEIRCDERNEELGLGSVTVATMHLLQSHHRGIIRPLPSIAVQVTYDR